MINENNELLLIDFGMATRVKDETTGKVIRPVETAVFRGTVRYASTNAHLSEHLSMRDDLWSLVYTYYELLLGDLPWKRYDEEEKLAGVMKLHVTSNLLSDPLPGQMEGFINHLNSLKFEDTPDYKYLARCLRDVLKENFIPIDGLVYDWEVEDRSSLFYWPLSQ